MDFRAQKNPPMWRANWEPNRVLQYPSTLHSVIQPFQVCLVDWIILLVLTSLKKCLPFLVVASPRR